MEITITIHQTIYKLYVVTVMLLSIENNLVGDIGFEPMTSILSRLHSTTELIAHNNLLIPIEEAR